MRRVVVIGGGLAGLAAAVWLAEDGDRVTLLERRGRLGGRTLGFPLDAVGGELVDNGQHVIAGSYGNIFRYLESVGTREHVTLPTHFGVRAADGTAGTMGIRPRDLLRLITGRAPGIGVRDLLRAVPAHLRIARAALRPRDELDKITVHEWFQRIGMPDALRRIVWEAATLGVLNERPELASAHALATTIRAGARNLGRHGRFAFSIGYPTVDLHTLYLAGAQRVFDRYGADVRLRARARRIEVGDGRVRGVTMADGSMIEADAVVLAVPPWDLGGLLDQVPGSSGITAAAERLVPIPIMSVNLYLDRPIGTTHPWETLLGTDVGWVFDRTRMHGTRSPAGWLYALTTCASYELIELPAAEVVRRCMAALRAVYPGARDAGIVHAHVVPWRRATFSSRPGTGTIRPAQRTGVRGLALAGDWTQTDWPTTMEGAAQSAARAVEVLRDVPAAEIARH